MGGARKPALRVAGRTILERQLDVLRPLADEILLVGGHAGDGASDVRDVADLRPELGPLAGLEAALASAQHDAVLLLGGDMPALQAPIVELVRDAPPPTALVVPAVGGEWQPLLARYPRTLLDEVSRLLDQGRRSLQTLLYRHDPVRLEEKWIVSLDPRLLSFENVNTPEDLARVEALLRG
jgi:molybdenum cofactor guanylyltransferase